MQNCHANEVPTPVIALVAQYAEGVQFSWAHYLCGEFLVNCRKAQDLSKSFHYAWLMLSIVLVTWELLEDSQFPLVASDLLEVVKYASLWETNNPQRIKDNKIFWILMEMNMHMAINHKLRLSPTNFDRLQEYMEFKVDFDHISIWAQKDPE